MTMRSKQWYTKASRLPNSLAKVSIGPLPGTCSQHDHRTEDRWNPAGVADDERLPPTEGLAEGSPVDAGHLPDHGHVPARRIVWADQSTATMQFLDPGEPRRGMRKKWRRRIRTFLLHRYGIGQRVGVSPIAGQRSEAGQGQGPRGIVTACDGIETHAHRAASKAER